MTTPTPAAIRAWARANGHQVADSGRIPAAVRAAYDAAHQEASPSATAPAAPSARPPAPRRAPAPGTQGPQEAPAAPRQPWAAQAPTGYAPPQHPAPPPWGAGYGAPARQGTDGFAITALVLGFFGVLGLVFGVIALLRIRRSGRPGRGLAIAGVVLSTLWIAAVAAVAITTDSAERSSDGVVQAAGTVSTDDLQVGDCPKALTEGRETTVDVVPCSEPHEAEVIASFELEGEAFPGEDETFRFADGGCNKRIVAVLPPGAPEYGVFYFAPSRQTWALGDREVVCLVTAPVDGEPLTGRVPRADP